MSMRLRILGAMMRPVMRRVFVRADDPRALRRQLEWVSKLLFRPVPYTLHLPTRFRSVFGAMRPALWVSSRGDKDARKVVLYFHGGGYIAGSPDTHRHMIARLSRLTGMRVFLPSYRLAPEFPIPSQLEDARGAHAHLLKIGYAPEEIILGGDSAGGGIALALLAELCQAGRQPASVFVWSPFCDQSFSGASVTENSRRDHFFPGDRVHELAALVLGDTSPLDPRASPLFADFPDCPPVLLQVGTTEILRDDAVRMAEKLSSQGTVARVEVWENAPHVWQILDGWLPEARQAISSTAAFIRQPRMEGEN